MHLDDSLLVERSRDGDLDAFEELVKRYESKVYTITFRFTGNHADASDLAQDAFIRAYQALRSFRGDASFATWLFTIASNVCRDELRKQQRKKKVSLDEVMSQPGGNPSLVTMDMSPQECLERNETQDLVQRQLNSLSEDQRLILVMREIQGLSYEEIASALECSLGTVKSRLSRARRSLKQKVLEHRELFDIKIRLPNKGKEG
ncbi:MAG: sigma-70 family RNA polymerase sigma factor [Peptococcaceae bacterium]|nr:sigma-70 family RNA polymerase sigma factor [Peptococcaceae bacterium]